MTLLVSYIQSESWYLSCKIIQRFFGFLNCNLFVIDSNVVTYKVIIELFTKWLLSGIWHDENPKKYLICLI